MTKQKEDKTMSLLDQGKVALLFYEEGKWIYLNAYARTRNDFFYHYEVKVLRGDDLLQTQGGCVLVDEHHLKTSYARAARIPAEKLPEKLERFWHHDRFEEHSPRQTRTVELPAALWVPYLALSIENAYIKALSETKSLQIQCPLQLIKEYLCKNVTKWTSERRCVTVDLID
jgi:hypothetical protein